MANFPETFNATIIMQARIYYGTKFGLELVHLYSLFPLQMNKMVAEIRTASAQSVLRKKAADPNQPVYEYDSDEETEGGTWEHKKRAQEMAVTLSKLYVLELYSHGL